VGGSAVSGGVEGIRGRAADLAARLSQAAGRSATIAQERAILRMLGVDGLDRAGHPLAASLVERYCGSDRGRLARGVLLPFAVALLEYDLPPREMALEVASGAIDLGLEAELLERPDRLAAAEAHSMRLLNAALARFDANKTASREMREVLGKADEPWLGLALHADEIGPAPQEAKSILAEGADVVLIRVPASWEYAEARRHAGLDIPGFFDSRLRRVGRGRGSPDGAARGLVPAGSQRGLAALRKAVDDAAAERGCYASLMTVTSAFAAPEQAVVAAFERIDLVEADPIREIVEDNVDPERALADHAFAHRLHTRAGSRVVVGSGPLALGADLASGMPPDAATRAGRALALQALGVELALADGLPADRLWLGAVPAWAAHDGDYRSILVQARLRRLVFPDHRLVIEEPGFEAQPQGRDAALVAALSGAAAALVIRDKAAGSISGSSAGLAAAAAAGSAMRAALGDGTLHGEAAELASRTLKAADLVLERLAAEGWGSLLGPAGRGDETERLGHAAIVERDAGPTSSARLLAALK
jgi:hypothetical protein